LHQQGITHGDLYAHNILWNEHGDCLLGDFGGASFHAITDNLETRALQRIEVRAFGVLLEELLARIDSGLSDADRLALEALQRRCCQADVLARPGFGEVVLELAAMHFR
jgi:serine/threonine protein kinase